MKKFAIITMTICSVPLLAGCREGKGAVNGDATLSASFVQQYYEVSSISVQQRFDSPYLQILPEIFEEFHYSSPASGRFRQLSHQYGDTAYNRPLSPFINAAYCNEFTSIDIVSDSCFDPAHPAGESLADIVRIVGASAYPYIKSGYSNPYDWRKKPEDYNDGNGISYMEGYTPVNKMLEELTAEDMYLLCPYDLYLKFTAIPTTQKHTFTVTILQEGKKIEGSVKMEF